MANGNEGSVALAASKIKAPSQGSTAGDISSVIGRVLAGAREERRRREDLALETIRAKAVDKQADAQQSMADAQHARNALGERDLEFRRAQERRQAEVDDQLMEQRELEIEAERNRQEQAELNREFYSGWLLRRGAIEQADLNRMSADEVARTYNFELQKQLESLRTRGEIAPAVAGLLERWETLQGESLSIRDDFLAIESQIEQTKNNLRRELIGTTPIPEELGGGMFMMAPAEVQEAFLESLPAIQRLKSVQADLENARGEAQENSDRLMVALDYLVGSSLEGLGAATREHAGNAFPPGTEPPDSLQPERPQRGGDGMELPSGMSWDQVNGRGPGQQQAGPAGGGQGPVRRQAQPPEVPEEVVRDMRELAATQPQAFARALPGLRARFGPQLDQELGAAGVDVGQIQELVRQQKNRAFEEADRRLKDFQARATVRDATSLVDSFVADMKFMTSGSDYEVARENLATDLVRKARVLAASGVQLEFVERNLAEAYGGKVLGSVAWENIKARWPTRMGG